jgi:hypothetical protein
MDIWSFMQREIKDYREALSEDSSFHQEEADQELYLSMVRKLNEQSFTLLKKSDQHPYKGINGNGENVPLNTIWDIVRRTPYLEQMTLHYLDKTMELPTQSKDYERFGDFVRYVANELQIPYRV